MPMSHQRTGGNSFSSWCCAGGITPKFLDRIQKTGDLLKTFLQPESRFHSLLKVRLAVGCLLLAASMWMHVLQFDTAIRGGSDILCTHVQVCMKM